MRAVSAAILFPALLLLAFAAYTPGLSGDFLFDDFPNLAPLGALGGIQNLEGLYSYLQSGSAGPTGRPVSLLSFLIDDNGWPSDPYRFKYTNLLVHLLVGVLLFWAAYRMLIQIGYREQEAALAALLAAALWLLHPFLVSTTLYVVQRMTQLAALFALAAIVGYLHGRSLLAARPRAGLVWMTSAIALGTVLATLSKENGVLVPTLILVMEWSLARHWTSIAPPLWWRIPMLWAPTLAVLGYLGNHLTGSGLLPTRPFDLWERLLTQPRILWDYLQHLFVPRIQTRGLYQDGYVFSTNLFSPWTTALAIAGIALLIAAAFAARRSFPLVALAIAFFLAGHLVESTTIGLELYFEHRNYLPAAFLFLPIAAALVALRPRLHPAAWAAILIAPVMILAAQTHQHARLWGNTDQLLTVWALKSPESPRAQNSIAQKLYDRGNYAGALEHLRQASERLPHSALLSVRLLAHQVDARTATLGDFERARAFAETQPFDAQTMAALDLLVTVVSKHLPNPGLADATHAVLDAFMVNPRYRESRFMRRHQPYLKMRLDLAEGAIEAALAHARQAIARYNTTETALAIVAEIANAGYEKEALEMMPAVRHMLDRQPNHTLLRTRDTYLQEIEHLEHSLRENLDKPADPSSR